MKIELYKSSTCPQCKVVKAKLDQKKLEYTEYYVDEMTPAELAETGVKGIPTLIVDGVKMSNIRDISSWIREQESQNGEL